MTNVFGLLALCAVLAGLYCFMGILMPSLSLPLMRSRRHAAMLWAACVVSFFVFAAGGVATQPPPTPAELQAQEAELQARETQRAEEQAASERQRAEEQQQRANEQKATEERNAQKQVEKEAAQVAEAAAAVVKARTELVEKQFSRDGSHRGVTKAIKDSMNDPASYAHDQTHYTDYGDHLIVITAFRGKNAFGGVVRQSVMAKVDLEGNVIQIIK